MDREKVIKGLEICSDCGFCESIKKYDLRCPYRNNDGKGCDRSQLLMDALALLQEQEEIVRCENCTMYEQDPYDPSWGKCKGVCKGRYRVEKYFFCAASIDKKRKDEGINVNG